MAEFDVAIVGAGFAGMYMLHRVRGLGLTARVLEATFEGLRKWDGGEPAVIVTAPGAVPRRNGLN